MKIFKLGAVLLLALGIVAGCSNEFNGSVEPNDPEADAMQGFLAKRSSVNASNTAAVPPVATATDAVEIPWPSPLPSAYALDPLAVTVAKGGSMLKSYTLTMSNGNKFNMVFAVYVAPGSVTKDVTLNFTLDKNFVGVNCSPDGTVFSTPILMGWQVSNLGTLPFTSDVKVGFYYANPSTGKHEGMPSKLTWADPANGVLGTIDASIPHFSKFCFGR